MNCAVPLLHRIDSALRESPYLTGRHLILETQDGTVILRGIVDSFFQKQMAQEVLRNIAGIERIQNHLEVSMPRRVVD